MLNCSICGKKIILVPSAEERAKKYGGKAIFYTYLFPNHADCIIEKRNKEVTDLMEKEK